MFDGEGVLSKSPAASSTTSRPWWLVLLVDDSIGKYYRHWLNYTHRTLPLRVQRPAWRSHISLVRGEQPPNITGWENLKEGRIIRFKYDHLVGSDGKHFWLAVLCPEFYDIRQFLGLPRPPQLPFHLTIGVRAN